MFLKLSKENIKGKFFFTFSFKNVNICLVAQFRVTVIIFKLKATFQSEILEWEFYNNFAEFPFFLQKSIQPNVGPAYIALHIQYASILLLPE